MSGLCLCVLSLCEPRRGLYWWLRWRLGPGPGQARGGGGWRNAAGIRSVYFDFYCVLQCLLLKLVFVHHNVQIMLSLDLLQRG